MLIQLMFATQIFYINYHLSLEHYLFIYVPFFNLSVLLLSYPWCYQQSFNSKVNSQNMLISKTICFKSNPCCSFCHFWGKIYIHCVISHKKSMALLFTSFVLCICPWCNCHIFRKIITRLKLAATNIIRNYLVIFAEI